MPCSSSCWSPEHLPINLNTDLPSGNVVRSGIEFDNLGRRVAYHLYRSHPGGQASCADVRPGAGWTRCASTPRNHSSVPRAAPGPDPGEPWLSRALVKLNELDQYDDAELVRKKTAAMFAGFVTRQPEDNLMGEGAADADGIALAGLEPGTLQILEPGEDIKFSDPPMLAVRTRIPAHPVPRGCRRHWYHHEQLTGDLTGVNYSSIRAGMLEFRRRCEMVQHGVLVHQMCRPCGRPG